jgi:phospholipid/cholesterol/gamma-HCH transport system substrate-binding protein
VALVAIAVLVLSTGGTVRHVRLMLANANGLRQGSDVKIGGAKVGSVEKLSLTPQGGVVADLAVDPAKARIGAGVSAAITTANLLGAEYVELTPGDPSRPLASSATIASSQITVPTDLDQVLGVLDADTRTRLQILINELGIAITHRSGDFSAALQQLAPSAVAANRLLTALVSDNHTLGDTVRHADGFIHEITAQRRALVNTVDAAGQTMETVAQRSGQLGETIARAPGTLASLQHFLSDLQATATPLDPAARALIATAPALQSTLIQLSPFERAARPTLAQATAVAPSLTSLGTQATPVLNQANTPLRTLAKVVADAAPAVTWADRSIEDALGAVQGWARSIQLRDGVGHYFRGHITISTALIDELAGGITRSLASPATANATARFVRALGLTPPARSPRAGTATRTARRPRQAAAAHRTHPPQLAPQTLLQQLVPAAATGASPTPAQTISQLLDYLLKP